MLINHALEGGGSERGSIQEGMDPQSIRDRPLNIPNWESGALPQIPHGASGNCCPAPISLVGSHSQGSYQIPHRPDLLPRRSVPVM